MREERESPALLVTEATAESALVEMLLTLELREALWEARAEVMLLEREPIALEADWGMEFWACFLGWLATVDGIKVC